MTQHWARSQNAHKQCNKRVRYPTTDRCRHEITAEICVLVHGMVIAFFPVVQPQQKENAHASHL
jgi:hypothetical protein